MLNKPKFMSPSINMYGNTVIDLNSDTLPFSCIVDGNEMITDWQIVVSRLDDNEPVFNTGKQTLKTPFFPINNRNQNVVFPVNLKEYFIPTAELYCVPAESTYSQNKEPYYSIVDGNYVKYKYTDASAWDIDYVNLYYTNFRNSDGAYYWEITFWGKSGSETKSAAEVFYANSIPKTDMYYSYDNNFFDINGDLNNELNLSTDEKNISVLQKRKIYLKSSYVQDENISIKRYGWRITDTTNNFVVMDTISKNQIYGIEDDISCECNGLVNDTTYLAELYIETQTGYFDIVQKVKFKIEYSVKNMDADFDITALNNASGIMLNWGELKTTEGVVEGQSVNYTDNFPVQNTSSVEIPNDSRVVFSKTANGKGLGIDENAHVVLSFQFDKTNDIVLFEMSGTDDSFNNISRELRYTASDRTLTYTVVKGNIEESDTQKLSETIGELCWCIVTLYPLFTDSGYYTKFDVYQSEAKGGLFPDDGLFPEEEYTPATNEYNSDFIYFYLEKDEEGNDKYVEYVYDESTWDDDWERLYYCLYPYFGEWDRLGKE